MKFKKAAAALLALLTVVSALFAAVFEASAEGGASAAERAETKTYKSTSGYTLYYRVYCSPSYDRKDDSKPAMLIYCFGDDAGRGSGSKGQLGEKLLAAFVSDETEKLYGKQFQYIVIAPQCPEGESFVNLPVGGGSYSVEDTPETEIMKAMAELISALQAEKDEKLFLQETESGLKGVKLLAAGVGSGATAAYDFTCRHPENVGRLLTVGGVCDPVKVSLLYDAGAMEALVFAEQNNSCIEALRSEFQGKTENVASFHFTEGSLDDCLNFALAYNEPSVTEWAIKETYEGHSFKMSACCDAAGGAVSVSPQSVSRGGSATVTVTPNVGYTLGSVKINGVETDIKNFKKSEKNERQYSYTMTGIAQDKNIVAEFVRVDYESRHGSTTDKFIVALGVISASFIAAACAVFAVTCRKGHK